MWCAAMFKQENALPRPELHFSIDNRHALARARKHHANMRRAVVATFSGVDKIIGLLGHEALKKFLEIFARRAIGIFHDDETATGVLNEHCDGAVLHTGFADLRLDFVSDFVRTFAARGDLESFMTDPHPQT